MSGSPGRRRPRPVAGWTLLTIGTGHLTLGAVKFRRTFAGMAADGIVGSVQRRSGSTRPTAARGEAFWFEATGVALLLLGGVTTWAEREGQDLPRGLGWGLAGTALLGGTFVPRSGSGHS